MTVAHTLREVRHAEITTPEQLRTTLDKLAEHSLTWHPDDDPETIVWDNKDITDDDIATLATIADILWAACTELGLDIYDEVMEAHVRAFGASSCFYPEHATQEMIQQNCPHNEVRDEFENGRTVSVCNDCEERIE